MKTIKIQAGKNKTAEITDLYIDHLNAGKSVGIVTSEIPFTNFFEELKKRGIPLELRGNILLKLAFALDSEELISIAKAVDVVCLDNVTLVRSITTEVISEIEKDTNSEIIIVKQGKL